MPTTTETHAVTLCDRRKPSRQARLPLALSVDALEAAMAVVGVDVTADLAIRLLVKDGDGGQQGSMVQTGPESFDVTVRVAKKDSYEDRHHYVMNNSLAHELRHVAQAQADPGFAARYTAATRRFGYQQNPYEVEARFYGRLADHMGAKDTGPAGPALGKALWALEVVK